VADAAADPAGLLDELLPLACDLARRGGGAALAGRRAAPEVDHVGTKSTATDLVTEHDRAAEEAIVAGLRAARPDDAVIGEEGTARPGTTGISWYVDPIDGTTNFVYGLPGWSTSIAAGDADGTLVGAVYVPTSGELFAAARGRGATLDGAPIRCGDEAEPALALLATGFSYDADTRRRQATRLAGLIGSVRDIRRFGSAAVDLCHAACGRVDAYVEDGLRVWDLAAGELIAREAGCRTGDFAGGPVRPEQVLVAGPQLFDQLVDLLAR
jgi:myo-inositol-1(or 4)-monophosphatase